jgi:hypothetical protein
MQRFKHSDGTISVPKPQFVESQRVSLQPVMRKVPERTAAISNPATTEAEIQILESRIEAKLGDMEAKYPGNQMTELLKNVEYAYNQNKGVINFDRDQQ